MGRLKRRSAILFTISKYYLTVSKEERNSFQSLHNWKELVIFA